MATRLVGNELDLNLSSLATGLVIIVVVVVCSRSLALDAAVLNRVAITKSMIVEAGW